MITIQNSAKCVITLKAYGEPTLRLFPGNNTVDRDDINVYIDDNDAALALAKEHLRLVDGEILSPDEKKKAKLAMEKNDKLNSANKVLVAANVKLKKDLGSAGNDMKEILAHVKKLEKKIEKLEAPKKESKKESKK